MDIEEFLYIFEQLNYCVQMDTSMNGVHDLGPGVATLILAVTDALQNAYSVRTDATEIF